MNARAAKGRPDRQEGRVPLAAEGQQERPKALQRPDLGGPAAKGRGGEARPPRAAAGGATWAYRAQVGEATGLPGRKAAAEQMPAKRRQGRPTAARAGPRGPEASPTGAQPAGGPAEASRNAARSCQGQRRQRPPKAACAAPAAGRGGGA